MSDVLLLNNSNLLHTTLRRFQALMTELPFDSDILPIVLHRFQDIAEYRSNFRRRPGVPLFNVLARGES